MRPGDDLFESCLNLISMFLGCRFAPPTYTVKPKKYEPTKLGTYSLKIVIKKKTDAARRPNLKK